MMTWIIWMIYVIGFLFVTVTISVTVGLREGVWAIGAYPITVLILHYLTRRWR